MEDKERNEESLKSSKEVHEVKIDTEKKPLWKKILFGILFVFGTILAIFINSKNDIDAINSKIKENKKKDKDLMEKADKVQENINELEKETEKVEEKIQTQVKEFEEFVKETKSKEKEFETKKDQIKENSSDLEANVDWVKSRFGGEVKID